MAKDQLNIEWVDIGSVKPYEKNAKKHPQDQVAHIAASLRRFGWKQPLVVDSNGIIVVGHGRYFAAQTLKRTKVPIVRADDLSEEEIKAYRLADNKTNESDWDDDLLNIELDDITNIDMSDFGFDLREPDEVVEDDYMPEPPEEPKAKRGDLYQLGRHRLLCGDATCISDVEKLVDGAQMDMLLTDPPYNVDYEGTAGKILNDKMADDKFRLFLADSFTNARMVMKNGAAFHIWHADSEGYNFRGACRDAQLQVRQCLIWEKDRLVLGRQDFQWIHEPCLYGEKPPEGEEEYLDDDNQVALYGWKDGGRHYWFKNRKQTTILKFDRPKASHEHPTMKPIMLFAYQMACNTKPGENVIDLFGGSGTTIMAAEQNGRSAYVMELDPKYVDVIIDRWESFTGGKAVLLNGEDRQTDS